MNPNAPNLITAPSPGSRTYGALRLDDGMWHITAEPHVMIRLKRVMEKINKGQHGTVTISNNPENCRELAWFMERYAFAVSPADAEALADGASEHRDHILAMEQIINGAYTSRRFNLAKPLRNYQAMAAELYCRQGNLLLADDVGLGKTAVAIGSMTDPRNLPALVVCYPFLQRQWANEIAKFAPSLTTHIIKSGTPYPLPKENGRTPDVLITTYHKINGWAAVLAQYCHSVVFDEGQELRHSNSLKYAAAKHIAESCGRTLLMSATPIYNFGGEMYNVLSIVRPGCLGTEEEFHREWCVSKGNGKWAISDPKAFGTYLRENFLMLRRTREEVGRELPEIVKIPHQIEADYEVLDRVSDSAAELAAIILAKTESFKGQRMQAAGQLDAAIRHATGVAKAPYAADFIRMLLESEERVIAFCWHHDVYKIISQKLEAHSIRVGMFTGAESPAEKERVRELFIRGEIDVLLMSLRSGAGVDGFQGVCKVCVFPEMDYSPGVHEQCVGRIHRDGQKGTVTAYFLVSDEGSDPLMAEILGLKKAQIDGIRNPAGEVIERLSVGDKQIRKLAELYINKRRNRKMDAPPSPPPAVPAQAPAQAQARRVPRFQARIRYVPAAN